MNQNIARCPSCEQPLDVTELTCRSCDLRLQGHFERGCRFCALDPEQRKLLDVFLASRGVIRDMEKALGLSYPTVRARVDALLTALGYAPTKVEAEAQEALADRRHDILSRLEAGEITVEEAIKTLRDLSR